ncbi:MAG: hypothetical protein AMS23_05600 [Bacteroides sp. SM1_62]|nr:MAG: hypothetical protein AMS23_05600 [Bacteroides sp. SM1_62]
MKQTFNGRSLIVSALVAFLWLPAASGQKLDVDKIKGMKARSIGPAGMSGRVTAIDAVVSNPDIIYIGTASGGVWKSESGGISWDPIFDKEKLINIGALAITQSNPGVIWVGTGEGNPRNSLNLGGGIYKSLDGGHSWEMMGLEDTRNIHRIIVDPRDENTVYVGAIGNPWWEHPERGVYKTSDGGKTWEKVLFVDEKTGAADLVMDPQNPNKLMAAMWEHRRWPWFFKSGGPGSGLYVTLDGGKTWEERTAEDGLPEGELGRMGLAISPSNPKIVYALVEAEKNALYRSDDGGLKWKKVSDGNDIGNRPFYYFELYVDSRNENRLYTLYSRIGLSEDGGKSFRTIASSIHSDHHAFWIHPEDPNLIIEGNDGGMAISRNRGETWHFMENLPLGQWYHIRVDNEMPYNVYGGLQDNGSWRGPGYVWRSGGIRNEYWQEVMFGDGFDVMPDPDDARYGYAMSQGGNVGRYDYETGATYTVKPTAPDLDTKLRFHWNAAMEQDPFDNSTIYFGSQFLHKSTDKGLTWEIISPDLTTNDPEKQKYGKSGGLTLDVTGAENHTTILAIAVSPVEKGVIWVGTDDGNVQVTRDGGEYWSNVSANLPGLPANSWIPQVQPSVYSGGEAWVVANNYRMGDFSPYAYRTKDYGASWERIVDEKNVHGYALSVLQDPVEANLVFLGTEHGLWVSIDNALTWTQWKHGYPSVSTMDMVIQEREADLVIGTFGRAVYILDDIRPLREIARTHAKVLEQKFKVFDPPEAILIRDMQQPAGNHFPGDATYEGENKMTGGILTYYLKELDKEDAEEKPKYDSVKLRVYDGDDLIRTLEYKAEPGLNKVTWRLRKKGVRFPNPRAARYGGRSRFGAVRGEPAGFIVKPGEYRVVMSCGDSKDSTMIKVSFDPRSEVDMRALEANEQLYNELSRKAQALSKATSRLQESRGVLASISGQVGGKMDPDLKEVAEKTKAVQDSINIIWEYINGKVEKQQGISGFDQPTAAVKLFEASRYIRSRPSGPTSTEKRLMDQADEMVGKALDMTNAFYKDVWPEYRDLIENTDFKWFKDYEPIEIE